MCVGCARSPALLGKASPLGASAVRCSKRLTLFCPATRII
ncbi:hypothetical protein HMPREF0454_03368 [Hafnia alvei ATCC 51873]|uniref:Uncharacterized protein n=1 Tax=Hafnia alvei ATCC 51873 TaxID=1002364 RepID=G9Y9U9_HAFAL|nr:hypothetical protein HMPREF0454_03368 [Hafnia alvei ATCC 51873]